MHYALSKQEFHMALHQPLHAFYELWTLKEALLKQAYFLTYRLTCLILLILKRQEQIFQRNYFILINVILSPYAGTIALPM